MLRKSNFVPHVMLLAAFSLVFLTTYHLPPFNIPTLAQTLNAHPATAFTLAPLQNIVQIATGGSHTCALTMNGGVKCWGDNGSGRLGDGSTITRTMPVDVAGLRAYPKTCAYRIRIDREQANAKIRVGG